MGFPDLKPLPDAVVSIPDAVSDAKDVISAAETAKKKRRAGIRPAKGAVAKLLKKTEAAQQTAGEPAAAAAQRAALDAALAAEATSQRRALRVRLQQHVACAKGSLCMCSDCQLSRMRPCYPMQLTLRGCMVQGAAAESAATFARYTASLLTSAQLASPATPAPPPSGIVDQVARRLGSILQDALLGGRGDAALEAHEGEKH